MVRLTGSPGKAGDEGVARRSRRRRGRPEKQATNWGQGRPGPCRGLSGLEGARQKNYRGDKMPGGIPRVQPPLQVLGRAWWMIRLINVISSAQLENTVPEAVNVDNDYREFWVKIFSWRVKMQTTSYFSLARTQSSDYSICKRVEKTGYSTNYLTNHFDDGYLRSLAEVESSCHVMRAHKRPSGEVYVVKI
ncbi:uncharacterized protein [Dasypus novemcinctus]|uniref:uncharacterized protein isoform X2 n=1 Tax=Dasypus novemcinctus TaxID=9361 RepID=UPI0039C956A5